jgi:hypothetical protein
MFKRVVQTRLKENMNNLFFSLLPMLKERLPALVRDLFTFTSKVIQSFIIVYKRTFEY